MLRSWYLPDMICFRPYYTDLPCSSDGKESACDAGELGSILGLGRSPGEGNGKSTPVFLPGESHGQRNLVGYSLGSQSWTRLSE